MPSEQETPLLPPKKSHAQTKNRPAVATETRRDNSNNDLAKFLNSDFEKYQTHKDLSKLKGMNDLDDLEVKSFDDVYQKKRHIKAKDKEHNDKQLSYLQLQVDQTRLRSGSSCENILND